jgi:uncharacterized membrane protein
VAKGISYRLLGTLLTTAISFAMTGSAKTAVLVGSAEVTFKVALFWGHERVWARIQWGRDDDGVSAAGLGRWLRGRVARTTTREGVPAP